MNLWEILKTSKGFPPPDLETLLFARKISGQAVGGSTLKTLTASGYPCVLEGSVGMPVLDYKIYGNSVQDGTPSPENPIEVQSVGDKTKNLWNGDVEQGAVVNTGALSDSNTRIRSKPIKVVGGLEYTISSNLYVRIVCCYKDGKFISTIVDKGASQMRKITTFIVPDGADTIRISFILDTTGTSNVTPDMIKDAMLELVSEATPYEPYGYKIPVVVSAENHEPITTNIYLDEPLRKIGDYADVIDFERGVVERKIRKVIFNGTETWFRDMELSDTVRYFSVHNFPERIEMRFEKSTHFERMDYPLINTIDAVGFSVANRVQVVFRVSKIDFPTTDSLKKFLNEQYTKGTPVTVYYALAEPTTEPISIPTIPTFDGTTVISTNTEIQPSSMEITYKAKKNTEV